MPSMDMPATDDLYGADFDMGMGMGMGMDPGADMFDIDSLLNGNTFDLDGPETIDASGEVDNVLAPSPSPSPSPSQPTRMSVAALLMSGQSSTPVARPKDILSLFEVESGALLAEKEDIGRTPPGTSAAGGTDQSPFAFHGSSPAVKSATKKKPAMSAASRMQLLKLKQATGTAAGAGSSAAVPAATDSSGTNAGAGLRKLNVNSLFGK